jgi:hypothetical protein
VARWRFVTALAVYGATAGGSLTSTDAVVTYDLTRSLVQHGSVALSGNLLGMRSQQGKDGRYYSPFGIGQSLYNVPFYLAGSMASRVLRARALKADSLPKAAVALGETVVAALIVQRTFWLSLAITGDAAGAACAAITLAFGSVLWPYARFGFNQPLACLLLLAAVTDAIATNRSGQKAAFRSGVWMAGALLTRHELMLGALPIGLWLLLGTGRARAQRLRDAGVYAGIVALGLGVWLAYNAARFGNPLDAGYLRDPIPGFGSPVASGMLALLFSPSASIFLYTPMALAGVIGLVWMVQRHRGRGLLLSSLVLLFFVFYATLGNWLGGRSYGSRYLLIVLPYLACGWAVLLCLVPARRRTALFAGVLVLGIAVQVPGVLVDYAKVSQTEAIGRGGYSTVQRQWDWRASALVLNTRAMAHRIPENLAFVGGWRVPPSIAPAGSSDDRGFSQQFAFSLDFWWLYLFYLGALSRAALIAVLVALVTAVTGSMLKLRAAVRALDARTAAP